MGKDLAVQLYNVVRFYMIARNGDPPVDLDAPFANEHIASAAGRDTLFCQKFVDAHTSFCSGNC